MTEKRSNNPQRLSTLLQRRKRNQSEEKLRNCPQSWSDYNSAPLAVKTVGGVLILPPANFAQSGTPTRKPWRSDQGSPCKKSAGPRRTRPDRIRPCLDPDRSTTAPRSPQTGAPAAGYARPTATGTAHRGPRGMPYAHARETGTAHNATGKPQDERKIKPGEITPGKRKCGTEPPRRRHAKRAGGREQGSKTPRQGRTPHQGEKKTRRKRCPRRV